MEPLLFARRLSFFCRKGGGSCPAIGRLAAHWVTKQGSHRPPLHQPAIDYVVGPAAHNAGPTSGQRRDSTRPTLPSGHPDPRRYLGPCATASCVAHVRSPHSTGLIERGSRVGPLVVSSNTSRDHLVPASAVDKGLRAVPRKNPDRTTGRGNRPCLTRQGQPVRYPGSPPASTRRSSPRKFDASLEVRQDHSWRRSTTRRAIEVYASVRELPRLHLPAPFLCRDTILLLKQCRLDDGRNGLFDGAPGRRCSGDPPPGRPRQPTRS